MTPLLTGIRVVEIGSVVLAPYAAQILADLGAEVVKVEPPGGDVARHAHPGGALFVANNRNKRMIALDLKRPEGREALAAVLAGADVLLHNMRLDAAARLGLAPDAVAAINPRLVHCAATGFGSGGPYADRPAFDDVVQAAAGYADIMSGGIPSAGDPHFLPTIVADKVAALHVVYAIMAALLARERGQSGPYRIEVPMFEAATAFLMNEHLAAATFAADGAPGYARLLSPHRRPYRTADGWIAVLPYTGDQWVRLLTLLDRGDIAAEPWFRAPASRAEGLDRLYALLADRLGERTTADWLDALIGSDIPCSRVASLSDLLDDPHLAAQAFFQPPAGYPSGIVRSVPQPARFAGRRDAADVPPATVGSDTRAVLREAGLDDDRIDTLLASTSAASQLKLD